MKKAKRDGPPMYRLTVTEGQLRLIWKALEWFERLQMGQFFDYCTEVALNGFVYDKSNPENSKLFDEYIRRRNDSQAMFDAAYRVAHSKNSQKTADMLIAEDLWTEIRHFLWTEKPDSEKCRYTVESMPPMHSGTEPPIGIERIGAEQTERAVQCD